jgi:two-component system response regulator DegU
MKQSRVAIVDDKEMIRTVFRTFLERHDGFIVVAEADNGATAIEMVEQHKPDVVLMDSSMPGLNGYEATKTVIERFPETKVIILSMWDTEEHRQKAREAGAVAYATKDLDPQEIIRIIQAAI